MRRRLLAGALFNKKEPQSEGDVHPFEDAAARLLGKLQMFHIVRRPTEQARPPTWPLPRLSPLLPCPTLKHSMRGDKNPCPQCMWPLP